MALQHLLRGRGEAWAGGTLQDEKEADLDSEENEPAGRGNPLWAEIGRWVDAWRPGLLRPGCQHTQAPGRASQQDGWPRPRADTHASPGKSRPLGQPRSHLCSGPLCTGPAPLCAHGPQTATAVEHWPQRGRQREGGRRANQLHPRFCTGTSIKLMFECTRGL